MAEKFKINEDWFETKGELFELNNGTYRAVLSLDRIPILNMKLINPAGIYMCPNDRGKLQTVLMARTSVNYTRCIHHNYNTEIGRARITSMFYDFCEKYKYDEVIKKKEEGTLPEEYRTCLEHVYMLDQSIRDYFPGYSIFADENAPYKQEYADRVLKAETILHQIREELHQQKIDLIWIAGEVDRKKIYSDSDYFIWCGENAVEYRKKIIQKTGKPDFWKHYEKALELKKTYEEFCDGEELFPVPQNLKMM